MRSLTPKEFRLLVLFIGLVLIMGNLFGLPALHRQQKKLQAQIQTLRSEEMGAQSWLKEKALWTERKAWLDEHQPKFIAGGKASSSFIEMIQQSAQQNKIKIVDQKLLDPEKHPGYQAIGIRMTVQGDMKSIVKWVSTLQQPKLFQAVTHFTLKVDGEAPNMKCEIDLARWYASSS